MCRNLALGGHGQENQRVHGGRIDIAAVDDEHVGDLGQGVHPAGPHVHVEVPNNEAHGDEVSEQRVDGMHVHRRPHGAVDELVVQLVVLVQEWLVQEAVSPVETKLGHGCSAENLGVKR